MWVIDREEYKGQVVAWDRGVQFGDGVFETMLVFNGMPQNYKMHMERLENSLSLLSINNKEGKLDAYISGALAELVSHSELHHGVLKVLVTRGDSARGYGVPAGLNSNITVFYSPLPEIEKNLYHAGVDLKICKTQCSINPDLSGMKHLNRLENVLAKQELSSQYEGLMQNYLGHVIEGTMSNVFFEKDQVLYTPKLDLSGVKGVMRRLILELCEKNDLEVHVVDIKLTDINTFDSAFICNSVMGLLPVKSIEQHSFSIGMINKQLQALIKERRDNE